MPEFGRLLADEYRAAHGLLTSDQLKERRLNRGLSQQGFADFLKRGVASVKRWELGKIQDPDNDRHIREMTDPHVVTTLGYVNEFFVPITGGTGTSHVLYFNCTAVTGTVISVGGSKKESQGCAVGPQATRGHTTSTSDMKSSFSSNDSTSSPGKGIEGFAHA
jgi:hypothetical protein